MDGQGWAECQNKAPKQNHPGWCLPTRAASCHPTCWLIFCTNSSCPCPPVPPFKHHAVTNPASFHDTLYRRYYTMFVAEKPVGNLIPATPASQSSHTHYAISSQPKKLRFQPALQRRALCVAITKTADNVSTRSLKVTTAAAHTPPGSLTPTRHYAPPTPALPRRRAPLVVQAPENHPSVAS